MMARPRKENIITEIEDTMTLNTYLATYSRNRNLDKTIVKWYQSKDSSNTKRTKTAWDKFMQEFNSAK